MNDNALILSALKAAKVVLSKTYRCENKEQFICHALKRSAREGRTSWHFAELAEKMIMERIGLEYYALEIWLVMKLGQAAYDQAPVDAVQVYRHRWLDALIKEFSK
jgi:hypothetical protein